jgi:glutaredoxin
MQTNSNTKRAIVWSQANCLACTQAKNLLDIKGISYEVRMLGENATKQELLEAVPDARSVPQIFLDGKYVGGIDALRKVVG